MQKFLNQNFYHDCPAVKSAFQIFYLENFKFVDIWPTFPMLLLKVLKDFSYVSVGDQHQISLLTLSDLKLVNYLALLLLKSKITTGLLYISRGIEIDRVEISYLMIIINDKLATVSFLRLICNMMYN